MRTAQYQRMLEPLLFLGIWADVKRQEIVADIQILAEIFTLSLRFLGSIIYGGFLK